VASKRRPVAIVTGGNSGIGFETARALAKRFRVILAVRSAERGEAAAVALRAAVSGAHVAVEALDLADLASVREFAAHRLASGEGLDLLVNNAGMMMVPKRRLSRDGFEMQFGVNHLGHFALTGLLWPQLAAAPGARVVTVASNAHRRGRLNFADLQGERSYSPYRTYQQAKLANLVFALELARRAEAAGAGVVSVAAHPGLAATNLMATGATAAGGGRLRAAVGDFLFRRIGQSARAGAKPVLTAATAQGLVGGEYFGPSKFGEWHGPPGPARIFPQAADLEAGRRLWEVSEDLTGVRFLNGV